MLNLGRLTRFASKEDDVINDVSYFSNDEIFCWYLVVEVGDVADESEAFAELRVDVGLIVVVVVMTDGGGITATLVCVTYKFGFADSEYFCGSPKTRDCSGYT